jgi:hypothetical protein
MEINLLQGNISQNCHVDGTNYFLVFLNFKPTKFFLNRNLGIFTKYYLV